MIQEIPKVLNQAKALVTREITYAPEALKLLNGYFCLYKPADKGFHSTRDTLKELLTVGEFFW